ncbi:hypothetical protein ABT275_41265 [Streptomyces sp. NPDC001185]|uniref:hypothetical protein n=1 Tax=Streptomyces sp. NPDC001185 TaxID=3154380 RepID=UPI00331799B6
MRPTHSGTASSGAASSAGTGAAKCSTYDFRQEPPPLVLLDGSAEDWSPIHQAPSFSTLLERFPENG